MPETPRQSSFHDFLKKVKDTDATKTKYIDKMASAYEEVCEENVQLERANEQLFDNYQKLQTRIRELEYIVVNQTTNSVRTGKGKISVKASEETKNDTDEVVFKLSPILPSREDEDSFSSTTMFTQRPTPPVVKTLVMPPPSAESTRVTPNKSKPGKKEEYRSLVKKEKEYMLEYLAPFKCIWDPDADSYDPVVSDVRNCEIHNQAWKEVKEKMETRFRGEYEVEAMKKQLKLITYNIRTAGVKYLASAAPYLKIQKTE